MASINNTPRPAYVYDTATNEWIPIGVGAHSHNEIPKTVVDAKGDLIVGTANDTVDRLAVGANGYTLVADSSQTTGLNWTSGTVNANPVLNSNMSVWQRGTSGFTTGSAIYTADRWYSGVATAGTISRQATSDTTNLPNIQYCLRYQRNASSTSTSDLALSQSFESVNSIPYAGKTVTFSFYARAGANYSATSSLLTGRLVTGTGTDQNLYSGYTGQATTINVAATLTTTWQRFTGSATVPSATTEMGVQFFGTPTGTAGANDYYEITGVQLDVGAVALPYRPYAGNIQGELAACQRYYVRFGGATAYEAIATGAFYSSTGAAVFMNLPVTLRTGATSIDYSTMTIDDYASLFTVTALVINNTGKNCVNLAATVASGGTTYRPVRMEANNSTSAYVGLSAEL